MTRGREITFAEKRALWLAEAHAKARAGIPITTERAAQSRPGEWQIFARNGTRRWLVFGPGGSFWGAYETKEAAEERVVLWSKGSQKSQHVLTRRAPTEHKGGDQH